MSLVVTNRKWTLRHAKYSVHLTKRRRIIKKDNLGQAYNEPIALTYSGSAENASRRDKPLLEENSKAGGDRHTCSVATWTILFELGVRQSLKILPLVTSR